MSKIQEPAGNSQAEYYIEFAKQRKIRYFFRFMDTIHIRNMVFYGYHGVKSEENSLGARFEVDVSLYHDLTQAMQSDRLGDTINYNDVYNRIEEIVTEQKFYLIEALAGEILGQLFGSFQQIKKIDVRVRKPNAPIKGVFDTVEVEISRERDD